MIKGGALRDVPVGAFTPGDGLQQNIGQVSPEAQARVYRAVQENFGLVGRLLRHSGVFEDVDDALQQVFMTFLAKLDQVQPGKEKAFLAGCAVHVASRHRRARGLRVQRFEPDPPDLAHTGATPEAMAESRQRLHQLDSILGEMDEGTSQVFLLFEVEELTMAEIAESLGLAPGTVASRIRRAREFIRERLTDGG
ncbi:MAG: sigma-70 family RNA polymerase sigma factor [Polyangiaceae bacterium]|nr:sigma-70 family RNA polymerase sigma factor [Polyangiaceae bacterium]